MRLFIAVPVPANLRTKAAKLGEEFTLNRRSLSFVKPENMHLTLKFLGETDEPALEKVVDRLKKIKFQKFECELVGVGAFPNESFVRVLWVGTESEGRLETLAFDVIDALRGINPIMKPIQRVNKEQTDEENSFRAHLTLARVKQKLDLRGFIANHKTQSFGKFEISEFHLIESKLGPQRPEYRVIERFKA